MAEAETSARAASAPGAVTCAHCGKTFKNIRSLQSHASKNHRGQRQPQPQPQQPPPQRQAAEGAWTGARFGNEIIEPVLSKLTNAQLRALLLYPEDAMCTDLPNLVWFNLDHPDNHTLGMEGSSIVIRPPRGTGRWRPEEPAAVLRASYLHFKKVLDMCRGTVYRTLTPVQQGLLNEYGRAVEENREITVSPYCPFHPLVDGGIISPSRMAQEVARTVRENCALPREDWVRTVEYAGSCLDCGP